MATIKAILKKDLKKDGTYPLVLRITKDGRTTFIYTDYSLTEDQWDASSQRVKKSHPNSARLNNYIIKKLSEASGKAIELETNKQKVSSREIKSKIKPKDGDTFFGQAQSYLDELQTSGKYNRYTADKPRMKHFRDFLKGDDIAFSDITVGMLEKFKVYLKGGCELGERSAVNHMVFIRSVFAHARKNEVVDDKSTPFGKGKMAIKFPDTKKTGLNRDEIKRLEAVQLYNPNYIHAKNLWLFSYYTAGMRISDVFRLRWTDIQDGRLHYIMGKNDKGDSIKIPEKAAAIAAIYEPLKENKNDLVFPDLKGVDFKDEFNLQRQIAFKTSRYDKFLRKFVAPAAKIDKTLTMHITRHTFAQNAIDIDVRTLQKLFRHSKLETTEGYMGHFITKNADDALDAVLGP